ncbi:MAG: RidA family protein [Desulfofustis sp.]|nr:RidA family protein [Desulfofustis sp.]MBT8355581.1 RidA family protein [Desulfofustis sp.]NNK57509.1 RidA family protein [Desulfofustis sp.]
MRTKKRQILAVPENKNLPFSTVVGFGDLAFVSGMIGRDPATGQIAADIFEQTRQTLANVEAQLAAAELSSENVLKATVFITDMGLVQEMNRAYRDFFKDDLPARSCVQVAALPDSQALVEIEVIAHR